MQQVLRDHCKKEILQDLVMKNIFIVFKEL